MWIAQTVGIEAFAVAALEAGEAHIILVNRPFTFGRYPNGFAFLRRFNSQWLFRHPFCP